MNSVSKRGLLGQITKIALLSLVTALFGYMTYVAFIAGEVVIGVVLAVLTVAINIVYIAPRRAPLKFLFPGTVLLALFVVAPIIYTILMSGFVYKTGNEIEKDQALVQIMDTGLTPDASNSTYDMVLGTYKDQTVALLTNQETKDVFLGSNGNAEKLEAGSFETDSFGVANKLGGFVAMSDDVAAQKEEEIVSLKFALEGEQYVKAESLNSAALYVQAYKLSDGDKVLTDTVNGISYKDNGQGNFVTESGEYLYPGWRALSPLENYSALILNPVLRGPFLSVFAWTITFSVVTVISMFAAGLVLALALDKKIRFRNFYRSILILPYAIPSFMSILIWNGMFNREFGAINQLLGVQVDWYNDAFLAKLVILIVNLWLGIPYFYLISTGALQALPSDIEEAAQLDGAKGSQIFRLIKLPLLLQILSPLLIASFAFNFNNFNIVYLLTGGGPTDVLAGETAGATDILITYAYKTAFGSAEQNLGLASAISVIMFLIVGLLSMWSLRRSKVLEEI
jgi:arabinogalactan oligomer / maltooligosaccharide transport system permease protein